MANVRAPEKFTQTSGWPLLAGCSGAHEPVPPHVGRWDVSSTQHVHLTSILMEDVSFGAETRGERKW